MARNLNRAQLIGHLGADPSVYQNDNGIIVRISLATSYSYKNSKTGEKVDHTEWHRIIFFGKLAEIVQQYLHKGDKILVEGALRTKKWIDKDKIERYTTEIMANNLEMLGSPSGKQQASTDVNPYQPTQKEEQTTFEYSVPFAQDDDIPF